MCLRPCFSAFTVGIALGFTYPAIADEPKPQIESVRAGGGEVIDFGSFKCTAAKPDGGKLSWTCPKQSFQSKFKEPPVVFFSIAGFDRLAPLDGSFSLNVDTKDEIAKDGFQPVVDERADKSIGLDKSAIRVTWIAIGLGERPERPRLTPEERQKQREMRNQQKHQ